MDRLRAIHLVNILEELQDQCVSMESAVKRLSEHIPASHMEIRANLHTSDLLLDSAQREIGKAIKQLYKR